MRRDLAAALLACAISFAAVPARADERPDAPPPEPLVFVVDPTMGVETTVRSVDSMGRFAFRLGDMLPGVALDESRASGKLLAVFGRLLRLVFLDVTVGSLVLTVSHEVGGHGARGREHGSDPAFVFYLPEPYRTLIAPADDRPFSAYTEYLTPRGVFGDRALLGTLGGLEANYVHAWWINARIVRANGWVHHGDLLVYAGSKLAYGPELLGMSHERHGDLIGDPQAYVGMLADRFNRWRPGEQRQIARRLETAYLWNLFDPTLVYALYGTFVSSVWQGKRTTQMPLPSIGGTTVFLSPRFALSPFGAEHTVDLFLARDGRMLDLYGRFGTSGLADYHGFGARALGFRAGERVTLGGELDVWRQPEILLDDREVFERPYRVGVNAGVFAGVRVVDIFGITGKLAAKTPGWIVGQPVGGGVHGYVGVSADFK